MPNIDILLNAVNQNPNVVPGMTKDLGALEKVTGPVKQGFSGLQNAVGFGLKAAAGIGAAGIAGLGLVLKDSIGLAKIQINAEKQLDAVLKSTGHAAGLTAQELKDMASGLQQVTNFGDEAIIQGQNLLLTFTGIGKEVFPAATETMLDMSQALGQDMKSSAIQLGKALNDPINGVTALSRVGVSFTDQQKEQIKAMQEAGDVAGAQKLILAELAKEFGGSARAMADPAIQLSNAWGDFKEVIGMAVLPLINDLAQKALPLVQNAIGLVSGAISTFSARMEEGWHPIGAFKMALAEVFDPGSAIYQGITGTIDLIQDLADVFRNLFVETTFFEDAPQWVQNLQALGDTVRPLIQSVIEAVTSFVSWKDAAIGLAAVAATILIPALVGIITAAAPVILTFAAITAAVALLRNAWEHNFLGIQDVTKGAVGAVRGLITDNFGFVVDWWNENLPRMQQIVETVWSAISGIFQGEGGAIAEFMSALGSTIIQVVNFFMKTTLDVVTVLLQLLTGDFEGAKETISGIWNRLKELLIGVMTDLGPALLNLAVSAVNGVKNAFSSVDWGNVGRSIIDGIRNGVSSAASALASAAANAARSALDAAKRALGIRSPSAEFERIGQQMMAGMAQGIQRYSAGPALAAAGAASMVTNSYNIPINVQVGNGADPNRVARATRDELSPLLSQLRRKGL